MKMVAVICTFKDGKQKVIITTDKNSQIYTVDCVGKTATLAYTFKHLIEDEYDLALLIDDDICASLSGFSYLNETKFSMPPDMGVICGNREFRQIGSLPNAARHVWGVIARPIMRICNIPYGGFMIIRKELIQDFIEHWEQNVFDDTGAKIIAEKKGYKFQHSAEFQEMTDTTHTNWPDLWAFVVRQYADVRLIGPWKSLLIAWAVTLITTIFVYYKLGLFAPLIYLLIYVLPDLKSGWRVLLGIPIAQLLFLVGVPYAGLVRFISWKHLTIDLKMNRIIR